MLLHEVLKETAINDPDRIAVDGGRSRISFRELEQSGAALAETLSGLGLESSENVAILLDKSIEAILAFLGVLKAGGCYVPLDVSAPVKRLSYIFQDAGIKMVITGAKQRQVLEEILKTQPVETIIVLGHEDGSGSFLEGVEGENIHRVCWPANKKENLPCGPSVAEDQPAYILYTSGSTGNPKGVVLSHRNALSFVRWACAYFNIGSGDVLSSHAPFYFDLSVFDIYVSLLAGAKLCLVPKAASAFPASLAKFIREKGISTWYSVPSVLVNLALHGNLEPTEFSRLKRIIYAGEAFPVRYLKELMKKLPHACFYNLYGPTETNVVTYYPIKEKAEEIGGDIPIGYACPYAEIRVLTEEGKEACPGERGELVARGASLMLGYLDKPELTGRVIRPVRLDGQEANYYFTGDVVLVLEPGKYRFIGRKDHMVKVRGFRVELEEIEAALMKHGKIRACLVQCQEDEGQGAFLRAYVECSGPVAGEDILQFLKRTLPEYMIPYDIRFVDELKRNERGKIHRSHIPNGMEGK